MDRKVKQMRDESDLTDDEVVDMWNEATSVEIASEQPARTESNSLRVVILTPCLAPTIPGVYHPLSNDRPAGTNQPNRLVANES
jgi:hypothetical protein